MDTYKKLLLANRAWVKDKLDMRDDYFQTLADEQNPQFLWIGCSDSRVPPSEVTGTEPGEIFEHRNIANLVVHTDLNMLGVLQYSVEVLRVSHIIVCGHYGCGGIKASLDNKSYGLLNNWLRHIKDIYSAHEEELKALPTKKEQVSRLVELNVLEQVRNICETSIVQNAWRNHTAPMVHGWVYDLHSGFLKSLTKVDARTELPFPYQYNFSPEG